MKKTFSLIHPKLNVARRVEAVKHEVKKYQTRERKKPLPKGSDFWGFDCKFGSTEADAAEVHVAEINKKIDAIEAEGLTSFYLEVTASPQVRTHKPVVEDDNEDDDELRTGGINAEDDE